jgi:hypothetical protein
VVGAVDEAERDHRRGRRREREPEVDERVDDPSADHEPNRAGAIGHRAGDERHDGLHGVQSDPEQGELDRSRAESADVQEDEEVARVPEREDR